MEFLNQEGRLLCKTLFFPNKKIYIFYQFSSNSKKLVFTLIIDFLMVYLSVWLRRSNVMTGAEWLRTRFGDSRGTQWSHGMVVIFAIKVFLSANKFSKERINSSFD